MMETPMVISKTMMTATTIPIFPPVLRLDKPADAPAVEVAAEAVVIVTSVDVKTVLLRPMTMFGPGCCSQPACRATITKRQVSKKSRYSVSWN
jgi:hypothetical protein